MTTLPAPSARPPSRRFDALDRPEARAFVEGAARGGEGAAPPSAPPATPERVIAAAMAPASAAVARPAAKERHQPVTLRVPEAMHAELLYIAENGSRSMNAFIVDVLRPAIEAEVAKIERRKALGLD